VGSGRRTATSAHRHPGGSGSRRSLLAVGLLLAGWSSTAHAQLEVLLRGLEPAPPHVGVCGVYRFASQEAGAKGGLVFTACIERIAPGPQGSVFLRLTSGDSLDARLEVAPALFQGTGSALVDQVRSIIQIAHGDTTRMERKEWAETPGLARAPSLPAATDSSLGGRAIVLQGRTLASHGRHIHEANRQVRSLGNVQMTQAEERDIEVWTSPEAPLLGLVRATATIRSERKLSAPVPGVPERGPRLVHYELDLLEIPVHGHRR
jgi:hypothetical protein